MKKFLLFAILAIICATAFFAINYTDYVLVNEHDSSFEIARILDKNLILLFSQESCHDCEEIKNNTLSNIELSNFLKSRFVITEIDIRSKNIGTYPLFGVIMGKKYQYNYSELYKKYDIKRTPSSIVFNSEKKQLGIIERYKTVEEYRAELVSMKNSLVMKQKKLLKSITDTERKLLTEKVKYVHETSLNEFINNHDSLNQNDIFILTDADEFLINESLESSILNNFNILYLKQ